MSTQGSKEPNKGADDESFKIDRRTNMRLESWAESFCKGLTWSTC